MTIDKFKKEKIEGREELFNNIVETFKKLNPVAIHQFGSGIYGYQDEFSDLDLWFTFKDADIDKIIQNRSNIFENIAPILVKHESVRNSPLEGKYSLVLFETPKGIFQVDFYFSKQSKTVIRNDAKLLYGDDNLERGEWIMAKDAKENNSLSIQIDSITFMTYIGIKGVIRNWESRGPEFTNFIKDIYSQIDGWSNKKLKLLPKKLSFEFIY